MDMQALREEQVEKASQIVRIDDLGFKQPTLIAGADVGFEQGGDVTRAAIAVLRYPSLELVEYQIARIETQMPYIPGFLNILRCSRRGVCCNIGHSWWWSMDRGLRIRVA